MPIGSIAMGPARWYGGAEDGTVMVRGILYGIFYDHESCSPWSEAWTDRDLGGQH